MKCRLMLVAGWLVSSPLFATQYKTFEENGKVGMKDDKNQVVLPPSFDALGWSDGSFSVIGNVTGYRLKGQWGVVSLKNEFVTRAEFESLVHEGGESIVARKRINGAAYKTGCLNLQGETKIPFNYDGVIVQGLRAIVFNLTKSGFRYGLVDVLNKPILPVEYKYIQPLGSLRFAVENNENKIALFTEEGLRVTDFVIDSVSTFYKGYAIVYQDFLKGLIDREGNSKLAAKYQNIKIGSDGKVTGQLPNEWRFINEKNETIGEVLTEQLKPLDEKSFYIKRGGRWGVVDGEMKPVIPISYESILKTEYGFIASVGSKLGVVDAQNHLVIPFQFDSLIVDESLFRGFVRGQGWVLLSTKGQVLTNHFYQKLHPLAGKFLATTKGFCGLVNSEGKEFIHCVFDSIAVPVEPLVAVKFKGKYGIVNSNEDWRVAPQDFPLRVINDNMYLQIQPDNQFVKSFSGETKYFSPYPLKFFTDHFIESLPDGTEKTVSYDGLILERTQTPEQTEIVFPESEGMRGIRKDDRYGFVDIDGRLRIANRYDSIGEFHEDLAAVKLIGKWGFVNKQDNVVINPNYDHLSFFQSGVAVISRNGKYGLINGKGSQILQMRYDNILRRDDSFLLTSSHLQGLADKSGNVVIEPRFDSITPAGKNLLIACRDGKCGAITDHGLSVIPMIYDQMIFCEAKNVFLVEKKSEWKEIELN